MVEQRRFSFAISDNWLQVVTKRTKNLKKQEIPSLDDPISKLNHIGKETVKKLNELAAAATDAEIDLRLPPDLHRCRPTHPFPRSIVVFTVSLT